jgi:hypothetical protein
MDPIYTDNAYGTRRIYYGAKYNNVAVIRISVMKANGKDFTESEVRDFLRWTTGSRAISYLDLSDIVEDEEVVKASFLGRITAVYQQKIEARTVGFVIEHTSISPYAYSPINKTTWSFDKTLDIADECVIYNVRNDLIVTEDGVLTNGVGTVFDVTDGGTVFVDNHNFVDIDNDTDDLSDYIYLDTVFTNVDSVSLSIKNEVIYEESGGEDGITEINGIKDGEIITLSSGQFIKSSYDRMFGNDFNFIWPKLLPGKNTLSISGAGEGIVEFTYRTPLKIGDCAIDIEVDNGDIDCYR